MKKILINSGFGKLSIVALSLSVVSFALAQENVLSPEYDEILDTINKIQCQKDFIDEYLNGVLTSAKEIYFKDVLTLPGDFFVLVLYSTGIVEKFGICNKEPWDYISMFINGFTWVFVLNIIKSWIKSD
jgi:hypothetical protein